MGTGPLGNKVLVTLTVSFSMASKDTVNDKTFEGKLWQFIGFTHNVKTSLQLQQKQLSYIEISRENFCSLLKIREITKDVSFESSVDNML